MWTFYDFLDGRGNNLIRLWLNTLPDKARAKINTRLLFMRALLIWPEQYVSSLKGWPELVELRVVSAGNQYRHWDSMALGGWSSRWSSVRLKRENYRTES